MAELSRLGKVALKFLGHFRSTKKKADKLVKGWMWAEDGAELFYLGPEDLKELADGLYEVASWLEERSTEPEDEGADLGREDF